MIFWKVEDVGEYVECMYALSTVGFLAWAFEFVADGNFEFSTMDVFQNKAGSSCDANQIELLFFLNKHLDLFYLQLEVFLVICLRHATINII